MTAHHFSPLQAVHYAFSKMNDGLKMTCCIKTRMKMAAAEYY
jgi:hypothetical protein